MGGAISARVTCLVRFGYLREVLPTPVPVPEGDQLSERMSLTSPPMVFLPSLCILLAVSATTNANNARSADLIRLLGPQGVNLARLDALATPRRLSKDSSEFGVQEVLLKGDGKRTYDFRAEWFQQPLDHFDGESSHVWHQRFWVNSRYYKPGTNAPVIVIDGGETSGEVRSCSSLSGGVY